MTDARFEKLKAILEDVDTELVLLDAGELAEELGTRIQAEGITSCAVGSDPLLAELAIEDILTREGIGIIHPLRGDEERQSVHEWHLALAGADVGITSGIGLAEETGSVLLPPHQPDERALSLLPTKHWIMLDSAQLVPDIGALFALWGTGGSSEGSAVVVTGPSRTADIEKELVLGVHGPQAVTIFLITQPDQT